MAVEILTDGTLYLTGDIVKPEMRPGDTVVVDGVEYRVQETWHRYGWNTACSSARAVPADRLLPVATR